METLKLWIIEWKVEIIIVSIIISGIILTRLSRWLIDKTFVTASERLKVDPTRYKFFKNALSLIIWLMASGAVVSMIPALKTLAITLLAGAGILVAIIGFAAQQAFSNIISGVFIVMFRPFRVGDMIKVGSHDYGIVEDITLRHTVIKSFENKRIIIPNATVGFETIINDFIEDPRVCRYIEVGIGYDSDIELASQIMQEVAMQHPDCIDARTPEDIENGVPVVVVRFMSFDDYSIRLRAYVWTNNSVSAMQMHSDINKGIKSGFDKEGIEIPYPYRTIVYKQEQNQR